MPKSPAQDERIVVEEVAYRNIVSMQINDIAGNRKGQEYLCGKEVT